LTTTTTRTTMNFFTTISFIAGVLTLIVHLIHELDQPGIFKDNGVSAIGLLVMAGVAHMIWGKK
jgi:ribosome-interacting GTPase 1